MKRLFLLGSAAIGTSLAMALSGILAGRHALTGFDLVARSLDALFIVAFLTGILGLLANDIAAATGLSSILGRRVEFHEIRVYPGESGGPPALPVSLRTKLCVLYPSFIVSLFVVLTIEISRS